YSRTSRFDQAIAVYNRALRLSPGDKVLLINLGLAFVKQDSYAEALPVFQKVLKADPRNLQARELLATSQLHVGQTAAAVSALAMLRAEDPRNTGLLYLLGVGYLKLQQPVNARKTLEAFLENAPPAQASFVLCKAYYEGELFDEAARLCRGTLQADAHFAGAHRELGKVLVSLRSPDAVKELAAAVEEDANDSEALYFLGAALLQEDRTAEAVPHLERARQLNPGFWGNYFYLGKAMMQANQPAQAVPLFEKAAALNSSESATFYQLGRALQATGRPEEARRAMDRVRELKALGLDSETKALRKP
ncbi:MAG TPA: tetratricopeptide repeat protein, partial [Candidatus Solibacter sp.]|nr:tetratricopeptide repeat protein [Candidatus Solibacter sp.]